MILVFADPDNDPVWIDSAAIVAVSIGRLKAPRAIRASEGRGPLDVTLVHTAAGPILVSESAEIVVDAWREAQRTATREGVR